jgi:DNA-binding NtrC family response regulator
MASLITRIPGGNPGRLSSDRRLAIVVEPDPDMRGLAAALLEESELSVIECTSAEAAIGLLQARGDHIAFLFADEDLAGVAGGLKLAQAVNADWPHVHVVVTTADPNASARSLPRRAVAIPKPWRGLDVLIAAERAIARH